MYSNLKAEMARKGITLTDMAERMDINISTLSIKLNLGNRIKLHEAYKIRDMFFPDMTVDYLFATDEKTA